MSTSLFPSNDISSAVQPGADLDKLTVRVWMNSAEELQVCPDIRRVPFPFEGMLVWELEGGLSFVAPGIEFKEIELCGTLIDDKTCCVLWMNRNPYELEKFNYTIHHNGKQPIFDPTVENDPPPIPTIVS